MPSNSHIRGTVTGTGGALLEGIAVTATSGSNVASGETAADGTYALAVPTGSYVVSFSDPNGLYVSGYYSDTGYQVGLGSATPVDVGLTEVGGIDVQLPSNPRIQGTVSGPDEAGLPDIEVDVYDVDGYFYDSTTTAADGSYSILVVAGTYEVGFYDPTDAHQAGYWSDTGFTANWDEAGTVSVPSADATAIDVVLPRRCTCPGV